MKEVSKRKNCIWSIVLCAVAMLVEIFAFIYEIPCAVLILVATVGTIIAKKKQHKIGVNVVLLVITILLFVSAFCLMHVVPGHDMVHLGV